MRFFRHRGERAGWHEDVIARLDALAESQKELRAELVGHVAAERPTPRERVRAFAFLCLAFVLICFSVTATILSVSFQNQATTASNEVQTASQQVSKDLQPILNAVDKYGTNYVNSHLSNSLLSDGQAARGPIAQLEQAEAQENHYDNYYVTSEFLGGTVLAISSAFFGAIAGWLILPALIGGRSRRQATVPK